MFVCWGGAKRQSLLLLLRGWSVAPGRLIFPGLVLCTAVAVRLLWALGGRGSRFRGWSVGVVASVLGRLFLGAGRMGGGPLMEGDQGAVMR